ncbi:hypothetical protein I5907_03295 [Panacibacter sp. DH6]|uniref:Peptidylamidoglycolate lyase n=1 Tax=Panacibacter microcysteis TaxID=2793269 RepID=A0A931E7M0_9BACT|nr:peptidyl-alpha-hydroxyglycine alpha-amidating lyase family protein [Panacibacter microcysteis]MBG9375241.1 hypothetical protein [Panacibacter microcysteis]
MKQPAMFCLFIICLYACNGLTDTQQENRNQYELVNNWPQLPDSFPLGDVTGIDVDTSGNVFVFHRASREWKADVPKDPITEKTVLELDKQTGKIINSWGDSIFLMPHGLTVDFNDNVWVTDLGLHQVFKFTHNGQLLMTLGQAGVSGSDRLHFNKPTSVAVTPGGSFYVADGYGNSRIIKFSPKGKFLFQWGTQGKNEGQFQIPHDISLDKKGNVYVADRENKRVQVFDSTGKFLLNISDTSFGKIYSVETDTIHNTLLASDYVSTITETKGSNIIVLDSADVIQKKYGRSGSYKGPVCRYHNITVDKEGNVYVGDILDNRIQKFRYKKKG